MDDNEEKTRQQEYYRAHPKVWERSQQKKKERAAVDPQYRADSNARFKRYAEAHPEKVREKNARIKARNRGTPSGQLRYILQNRRGWAKKNDIFFDDRLLELAKNPPTICPCCGGQIIYGTGQGQNPRSPSIDKVIATGEYTLDNVMIICKRCNQIKNRGGVAEHLLVIGYMARHAKRRSAGLKGRVEIAILGVKATIKQLGKGTYVTSHVGGHGGRKLKEESVRIRHWSKFEHIVRNARNEARRKGLPFDDDLLLLPQAQDLPKDCACCGVELLYEAEGQNQRSASIDAIDCSLGHVLDNVDVVCMMCNGNKNEGTVVDHEMIVAYIRKYTKHPEQ